MSKQPAHHFTNDHLLVFCCEHVFKAMRPVLYVSREDGDWQFLCGHSDHSPSSEPVVVGVGHLVETDPSLNALADLSPNWEAERKTAMAEWIRTPLVATQ